MGLPPEGVAILERPPGAQRVANTGALYLDHLGTKVPQKGGRGGAGDDD